MAFLKEVGRWQSSTGQAVCTERRNGVPGRPGKPVSLGRGQTVCWDQAGNTGSHELGGTVQDGRACASSGRKLPFRALFRERVRFSVPSLLKRQNPDGKNGIRHSHPTGRHFPIRHERRSCRVKPETRRKRLSQDSRFAGWSARFWSLNGQCSVFDKASLFRRITSMSLWPSAQ